MNDPDPEPSLPELEVAARGMIFAAEEAPVEEVAEDTEPVAEETSEPEGIKISKKPVHRLDRDVPSIKKQEIMYMWVKLFWNIFVPTKISLKVVNYI